MKVCSWVEAEYGNTAVIPTLRRLRQEEQLLETILGQTFEEDIIAF